MNDTNDIYNINKSSNNRSFFFFFQAEDGIRDRSPSRGLGDVYKRQDYWGIYRPVNVLKEGC